MRIFQLVFKTALHGKIGGNLCGRCSTAGRHLSTHQVFSNENRKEFIKRMKQLSSALPDFGKDVTLAGVLVPFCIVDGKPSILLTKRSHKIARNKGDVSFPGGKMDNEIDKSIVDTALRETTEEIGVPKCDVDVWLDTKPMIGTNDAAINIVPVIGFINNLDVSKLVIDQNEVSSVFTVTLEELCDQAKHAHTKFNNGVVMPLFYKEPYKIWGFTAIILDYCLSNLLPDVYSLRYRPRRRKHRR